MTCIVYDLGSAISTPVSATEHPAQFMLGDDLLIDPVTPGADTWDTYLPHGRWVDVWTGTEHMGGRSITRQVPLDVVPVYCRADQWPIRATIFN